MHLHVLVFSPRGRKRGIQGELLDSQKIPNYEELYRTPWHRGGKDTSPGNSKIK